MGGATRIVTNIITLAIVLLLAGLAYVSYTRIVLNQGNPLTSFPNLTSTVVESNSTLITTTAAQANASQTNAQLDAYALGLINADRQKFGLANVTLSSEPSAQQHSDSMLVNDYFSHWDPHGMKPYMRYTLLGGTGAVSENIAYRESETCGILGCTGNINVKQALQQMEYEMMYNDSVCCHNGHRDNILTPQHNQVSIGIAYNSSSVYFTEDFINDYINWTNFGIEPSSDEFYAAGRLLYGARFSSIQISYDPPVQNMTRAQLDNTSSYSSGTPVAGVVSSPLYYYSNIQTIVADRYSVNGNGFNVAFNMRNTIGKNGPGEYTVNVWLNDSSGAGFVGASYVVFVNGSDGIYTPGNV